MVKNLNQLFILGIFAGIMVSGAMTFGQQPTPTAAKASGDDPAAVTEQLFAAMREHSAEKIRALFLPDARLVAIDQPRTGTGLSKVEFLAATDFAAIIATGKGDYQERMLAKNVQVNGDLALVSGRYTFFVGDKFSHCGTDAFQLVRTDAGWKIAEIASTQEFKCDAELKAAKATSVH